MFDRILLPTDGSEAVQPAVDAAIDLADKYDATLDVLYVVEPPSSVSGLAGGATTIDDLLDELEADGRDATAEIADQARASGLEVTTEVRRGNPRDDILEYAEHNDVDAIVLGTHGRRGVKRTLLGSVTEAVVRRAEVPVLTVHRTPDG